MVKEAASQPAAPPDAGQDSGLVPLGSHQPVLDGLRGLAILLVLFHHFTVVNSTSGVDWILLRLSGTAWCGVDLFFVLSGFLIGGILLDSRGRPGYFRTFYARRTLRIFPLYYAVVALALVVLPAVAAWIRSPAIAEKLDRLSHLDGSQLWYWTYLSNYAIAWAGNFQNPILGVSWSLAIEEQFYLLWPAVVWLLPRRALAVTCVLIAAGSLGLRTWLVLRGADPIVPYVITPARLDALAIGCLLAIGARRAGGGLAPWRRPAAWGVAIAALLVLAIVETDLRTGWATRLPAYERGEISWAGPLMGSVGFTILPLGFACLLILAVTAGASSLLRRILAGSALGLLGHLSYGLYLVHVPVRALIRDVLLGPAGAGQPRLRFPTIAGSELPGQLLFYVVAGGASLLLAWLSWNLWEKHFLKLKRFVEYRPAVTPPPGPGSGPPAGPAGPRSPR